MKSFEHVVKDQLGIHARPAGMLVKEAKAYTSKIKIKKGEKEAEATKLMAVMSLGVKKDDLVTVTVEGEDEETTFEAVKKFFEENL